MFDLFLRIDYFIFFFINQTLSNTFFDFLMPIFDRPSPIIILFIYFIIIYYIKEEERKHFIFWTILGLILCDQSGRILKLFFLRERPWAYFELDTIHNLSSNYGKNLSFPSNHSANLFGAYIIISSFLPRWKKIFLIVAITIMFSRIYIGAHFPSDIIGGIIIGLFWGTLLIQIKNSLIR